MTPVNRIRINGVKLSDEFSFTLKLMMDSMQVSNEVDVAIVPHDGQHVGETSDVVATILPEWVCEVSAKLETELRREFDF